MSFNHKFCIAPMMQCTDIHDRYLFRLITKKAFLYTEMVTTGAIIHGGCLDQLNFNKEIEHPVAVQLGGSDPSELAECSKICGSLGYDEINLNIGCPSERVQKGSFGACLMQEPELVKDCIEAMQEATSTPITIKCRIGVNERDDIDFLNNFVNQIVNPKLKTIIVHARVAILKGLTPRQNRQIPPLKYQNVYQLKKEFPDLEIVINGGIKDVNDSIQHLEQVDGVMLGRSPYDNPMIVSNVDSTIFDEVDIGDDRKSILKKYIQYCLIQADLGHPLSRTLKHIFGLNRGLKNAKAYRSLILQTMQRNNLEATEQDLISMV
ncbi:tRNA dihydrouridine(20/20a) synthase DusA [Pseudomonadota bacterium]|uniref:tRNA-dihydrouridine(20/20a) synthase n=1 Tax=SAR86 cluster bacterium TaxID=2030880 RepID=A0A520LRL8_9GAMM|nr:tRNA dihydrouridine(20/20a) synthase DusA [Pseudomonadota bacterium]RZO11622.1 MAG: tRNA dihydrouridine(20/20a) synthase DusA [SAR86 cluster bacterium]|tara:strand:- start:324 stop:1286 length:963 start_codon:yes stop_codon:yes gene_type:complete